MLFEMDQAHKPLDGFADLLLGPDVDRWQQFQALKAWRQSVQVFHEPLQVFLDCACLHYLMLHAPLEDPLLMP